MKTRFFSAFASAAVCVLSMFSQLESCECLSSREYDCFIAQVDDKIYLNPERIIIAENHFFINVENNAMPVSALYTDANGIYLSVKKESEKGWTCPVCGYYNPPERYICENVRNHRLFGD